MAATSTQLLAAAAVVLLLVLAALWADREGYLGGRKRHPTPDHFRGAYGRTPEMARCWTGNDANPFFNACIHA